MNTIGKVIITGAVGVGVAAGVNVAKAQDNTPMTLKGVQAAQERTLDSMKYVIDRTKSINEARIGFVRDSLSNQKELNSIQRAYVREMNALMNDTTGELSVATTKVRITAEGGVMNANDLINNVTLSGKYFGTRLKWNASKVLQPYVRVQGNFGMTTPNVTAGQTVTQEIVGVNVNTGPIDVDVAGFYADRPSPGVPQAFGVIGEATVKMPQGAEDPIGFSMTAGGAGQYSKEGGLPTYRFDSKLKFAIQDSALLRSLFGLPVSVEVNYSPIYNLNTLLSANGMYAPLTTSTVGGKLRVEIPSTGMTFNASGDGGASLFRIKAGVGTKNWQLDFNFEQYNNKDMNIKKIGVYGSTNIR